MIFPGTYMRSNRIAAAEIKNNFDDAFGYDLFLLKRRGALHLPDRTDHIFQIGCLRYVKIAVQFLNS